MGVLDVLLYARNRFTTILIVIAIFRLVGRGLTRANDIGQVNDCDSKDKSVPARSGDYIHRTDLSPYHG